MRGAPGGTREQAASVSARTLSTRAARRDMGPGRPREPRAERIARRPRARARSAFERAPQQCSLEPDARRSAERSLERGPEAEGVAVVRAKASLPVRRAHSASSPARITSPSGHSPCCLCGAGSTCACTAKGVGEVVRNTAIDRAVLQPAFMHHYGMGILNASTWTISIELQFYAAVPLLYVSCGCSTVTRALERGAACDRGRLRAVQYFLAARAGPFKPSYALPGLPASLALHVSCGGARPEKFRCHAAGLGGRFSRSLLLYCVLALLAAKFLHWRFDNSLNPIVFTGLAPWPSRRPSALRPLPRLLRRNDLSYGVYLYHAPVINLLLFTQAVAGLPGVLAALTAALALAAASWWVIERPALELRRHPAYSH